MQFTKNFASDNNSGIHPMVLEAINRVNQGHCPAYGDDDYTQSVIEKFKAEFGPEVAVYFLLTGTGANVLGLKSVTRPFQAVICAESAHLNEDECGALENVLGCKLITLPTEDGKITVSQIEARLEPPGNQHHSQIRVVSLSQATEFGTVYTSLEIRAIAEFVHQNGLLLHMDGARLANAAAGLGVSLRELTADAGVDILTFGGAKNGLLCGEAVIFFKPELAEDFKYIRKQGMQLMAKMRFLAAQFDAMLTDRLWLRNAQQANAMARLLGAELEKVPEITLTQKVAANAVFAIFPRYCIPLIQEKYSFYVWNSKTSEVRLMLSYDTTEADVRDFVKVVQETLEE